VRSVGRLRSLLLVAALGALALGVAAGRGYAHAALRPHPAVALQPLPEPLRARDLARSLHGLGGLANDPDDPDRYGDPDRAVAERPAGSPARHAAGTPRVAIVVVDPERSASDLDAFAGEPFPLTVVVSPRDQTGSLRVALDGGKSVLARCDGADPAALTALLRAGATGIACSTADAARAKELLAAAPGKLVFDDLLDGATLYRAARHAHRPALTRDLTVDARDDPCYVAFLFAQALGIAERSGVATVVVHARDRSRRPLERFAARAAREGVAIVDLASLAR
jgi:hypothetical protein